MTGAWGAVFSVLGGAGLTALAALLIVPGQLRKLRAEARKLNVDAKTAASAAEDAHWEAIVKTQTENLVTPLQSKVERLEEKVEEQGRMIDQLRTGYWRAIQHIRDLRRWGHDPTTGPMPAPPSEIADDV